MRPLAKVTLVLMLGISVAVFPLLAWSETIPLPPAGLGQFVGIPSDDKSRYTMWSWETGNELEFLDLKGYDDFMALNALCRDGAASREVQVFACGAREYVLEVLFVTGTCYGKIDQQEREYRLHRCATGSRVPIPLEYWLGQ